MIVTHKIELKLIISKRDILARLVGSLGSHITGRLIDGMSLIKRGRRHQKFPYDEN